MEHNALQEFERANVGDYVEFGRYPQTAEGEVRPVEWQVLARENNKALVISHYSLDARRFDKFWNNWDSSEIREWLNGEFYNSTFSIDEKACIESFNQDYVFLLSDEEAEKYFADEDAMKCEPTSYAKANGAFEQNGYCYWWLRSSYDSEFVYCVYYEDGVDCWYDDVDYDDACARPALWINLELYGSNPFKNANVGDYVEFGRYPQTAEGEVRPVEWRVLARENNKALVISRYGLDAKRFGTSNNWDSSEIRQWLNGEFYNSAFSGDEKARIISFNLEDVFLLSREEAEKYFADDDARKCKPTSYAEAKGALTEDNGCGYWWLRSPNPNNGNEVYFVNCGGGIWDCGSIYFYNYSVRPALWINLES